MSEDAFACHRNLLFTVAYEVLGSAFRPAGCIYAAFLLLSATVLRALARDPVVASADSVAVLHQLAFAAGGAAHVVPLGIMVAAGSVAALRSGLHARWAGRFGVASAAVSLLSISTFVALGPLVLLIAVGRFSAFAYLIAREG
jgi:hypothetical protein